VSTPTDTSQARRDAAARLLRALGHPARVGIIETLADGSACVHELVDELGLDQPLVSQHLRVLRSANLLSTERRGKEVVYSLADHHVAHIVGDAVLHAQEQP
jgi:DNA-binding transcriptional ArsR family regulator